MSTILMSIKPEYVNKIFDGTKRYEYRKKLCKQRIDKIIVYSSSPIKKIVGELIIEVYYIIKKKLFGMKLIYMVVLVKINMIIILRIVNLLLHLK